MSDAAKQGAEHYKLQLFITGSTPRSTRAIENMRRICDQNLRGRYDLEVIDVRTLSPLDVETLVTSATKTGRVVVVHEAARFRHALEPRQLVPCLQISDDILDEQTALHRGQFPRPRIAAAAAGVAEPYP